MRYLIQKVWFHFCPNIWKYCLLILIDVVSMAVFMSCFNLSLSCADRLRELKGKLEGEGVELYCTSIDRLAGYPITPQDIKDYPGIEKRLFYFPYRPSISLDSDGNEYRFQCCFLSDAMFEQLFGMEREEDVIYIGRGAYTTLNSMKVRAAQHQERDYFFYYYFEGDTAYIEEGPIVDLLQVKLLDDALTNRKLNCQGLSEIGDQISLSDCVIMPLEMLETLDYETEAMPYKCVIAIYQGERTNENVSELMGFIRFLNERHPTLQYNISNRMMKLESSASDLMIPYRSLLLAAVSMLFIIMTGMIGIFILILHRRRRELAVSLAYGATRGQIFGEVFVEVFLCFFIGGLLAGAAAWYATPKLTIEYLSVTGVWHGLTTLCAAGITLLEAFGISGIALAVVGRENVAGTLKEL